MSATVGARRSSSALAVMLALATNGCGEGAGDGAPAVSKATAGLSRVDDGLIALYELDEESGDVVHDTSGVGTPLDLVIEDPAATAWQPGALSVLASTRIASPTAAARITSAVGATNEVSVEAWIRPANLTQDGPARIVTISESPGRRNLTLGQGLWGSQPTDVLDVRLRTTETSNNGFPSLSTTAGSLTAGLRHVVYTRDAAGSARIYIDGVERASGIVDGTLSSWSSSYSIGLANELSSDRPWLGELHLVALYDRALTAQEVVHNFEAGADGGGQSTDSGVPDGGAGSDAGGDGGAGGSDGGWPDTGTPVVDAGSDTPGGTDAGSAMDASSGTDAGGTIDAASDPDASTVGSDAGAADAGGAPSGRVVEGLLVLYELDEGAGSVVADTSGYGAPLDLAIEDPAATTWVPGALSVLAPTRILSADAATKVSSAVAATNEISVEAWARPANLTQDGPARIVTISESPYLRNMTLGQQDDALDVRLRTTSTSSNGVPSLSAPASASTELSHIVYTRDAAGTARIYVDGVERASGVVDGTLSSWDSSYLLGLANELTGDRPWLGELHLVALYDRALTAQEVAGSFEAGPDGVASPADAGSPDGGPSSSDAGTTDADVSPLDAGTADAGVGDGGCTPTTCTAAGVSCGTVSDGCGGSLDCGSCGGPTDARLLRRVAHKPVQVAGLSDGPRSPHSYFSVIALDSGEVAALNMWYHPHLFRFHPSSGALESRAVRPLLDALGNEDEPRWRLRAHEGDSAASSHLLWTNKGYQEIDSENGTDYRDAAVFSVRPVEETRGIMPEADKRVVNLGADSTDPTIGPGRGSLDYDADNQLVFVSMERTDISELREIFQVFRLDTATGELLGRARVSNPISEARVHHPFMRVDPAHRLLLMQASNFWEPQRDILYLAEYAPTGGDDVVTISNIHTLMDFYLPGHSGDSSYMPSRAHDAVMVEQDGRVYAILAANALYLFDLGPAGGPYGLGSPIAKVAVPAAPEALQVIGTDLVVSARGLHVYDLATVLAARGDATVAAISYPLPYVTYEMDTATIEGDDYLFVAGGLYGVDVFRIGGDGDLPVMQDPIEPARPIELVRGPATLLLESGGGLRYLGAPVANDWGDVALWAVTDTLREVILLQKPGEPFQVIADTSSAYVSLGRPSINRYGQVTFFAGKSDGTNVILRYDDGSLVEVAASDASFSYLKQPEIADDGDILFLRNRRSTGLSELVVSSEGGTLTTVFAEDGTRSLHAPREYLGFPGDYDQGPDGSVAFVRWDGGATDLAYWDGQSFTSGVPTVVSLFSDQPAISHVRIRSDAFVTTRSWASEVIRLRRTSTSTGTVVSLADRHTEYDGYWFGNFTFAAANSSGDTVFVGPKYIVPTMDERNLGHSLFFYDESSPNLPDPICHTADVVDGRTVRNVEFVEGFNEAGTVRFTAELQDGTGAVGLALIAYDAY